MVLSVDPSCNHHKAAVAQGIFAGGQADQLIAVDRRNPGLIEGHALDRGFITADADLSPERRLTGGNGAGLATYRELITNMATKASPDGNALPIVLSRHFIKLKNDLVSEGVLPESDNFEQELKKKVYLLLSELEGDVGGFDFARVLGEYYSASIRDDSEKKSACLRWLRGEFSTKTEAKCALGFQVSVIIDDDNWYNFVKLFALLSVLTAVSIVIIVLQREKYKMVLRELKEDKSNVEFTLSTFMFVAMTLIIGVVNLWTSL